MTDLVVTAANVLASGGALKETGVAGVALTAGETVYKEAGTSLFKLSDSNSATAEVKAVYGITLNAAGIGQPVTVVRDDPNFTVGATLVAGTAYYLSETPGGIQPAGDLTTGETVIQLGIAKSTTVLALHIIVPGVTL